ncbi:hypothetical protein T03_12677 [Trichinella britovi]|uniref:Uncharacterized protein n=1 Tax=Trichinella britovi TaxID=45882 RepID=A0A0V1DCE7_TRIBR|nr:hypothetical protein T03_12677 [Trichinella britovi]
MIRPKLIALNLNAEISFLKINYPSHLDIVLGYQITDSISILSYILNKLRKKQINLFAHTRLAPYLIIILRPYV